MGDNSLTLSFWIFMTGYNLFSLIRASAVVKRQSTVALLVLRSVSHASVSSAKISRLGMCPFKHCRLRTLNSISAILSQLPCLGVYSEVPVGLRYCGLWLVRRFHTGRPVYGCLNCLQPKHSVQHPGNADAPTRLHTWPNPFWCDVG